MDEPLSTLEPEESTCAKRVSVCWRALDSSVCSGRAYRLVVRCSCWSSSIGPFAGADGIAGGVSNNYQTAALPTRLLQPFTISGQP